MERRIYAAAIERHAKAVKALGNATDAVFDKALNDTSSSRLEAEFAKNGPGGSQGRTLLLMMPSTELMDLR